MDMENSLNAGSWVTKVADELAEVLQPTINLDWEIKTPDLDWTQSQTAIHTMRACLEYSYQVVGKRIDTYQPVLFEKKDKATPPEYLPMITTAARVLEKVVKDSDPSDRAWHAYGISDAVGFAAMGVVEVSVHTYDLAKGFGIDFIPNSQAQNLQSTESSLAPPNIPTINHKVNFCCGWLVALNSLVLQEDQAGNGMAFPDKSK